MNNIYLNDFLGERNILFKLKFVNSVIYNMSCNMTYFIRYLNPNRNLYNRQTPIRI